MGRPPGSKNRPHIAETEQAATGDTLILEIAREIRELRDARAVIFKEEDSMANALSVKQKAAGEITQRMHGLETRLRDAIYGNET